MSDDKYMDRRRVEFRMDANTASVLMALVYAISSLGRAWLNGRNK